MNYGEIKLCDIANGEGVRVSLFVSGCTHHCKNCFNPQTWSFDYGEPFTKEVEDKILKELEPSYIDGLSLLGGEPFEPSNQRALVPFLKRVRENIPTKQFGVIRAICLTRSFFPTAEQGVNVRMKCFQ